MCAHSDTAWSLAGTKKVFFLFYDTYLFLWAMATQPRQTHLGTPIGGCWGGRGSCIETTHGCRGLCAIVGCKSKAKEANTQTTLSNHPH